MRISTALLLVCSSFVTSTVVDAQILTPPPAPTGNPITPTKILLGKALFWDEQMSSSGTVACGTCHIPAAGGTDPRAADAIHPGLDGVTGTADDVHGTHGVIARNTDGSYALSNPFGLDPQVTNRAALSPINAVFRGRLFWDGRAGDQLFDPITGDLLLDDNAALETQALAPPLSTVEMGHAGVDWPEVAARLQDARPLALATELPLPLATWIGDRDYAELFAEVFGSPGVTPARIVMAIATYERTLISDESPADLFFQEVDDNALTPAQFEGAMVYLFDGGCNACHRPTLLGGGFFDTGVRPIAEDPGLGGVTGLLGSMGRFRAPDLHNVGLRPVHFHHGGANSLEEVVEFYDRGGDFRPLVSVIGPLGLTQQQKDALVHFLETALIDPRVAQELPPFDRPRLYAESVRVPATYGYGTHGTFGYVPELVAVDPPVLGNTQLTIGLREAAGGRPALLLLGLGAGDGSMSVFGADLMVDLATPFAVLDLGDLTGSIWGAGMASVTISVPAESTLEGVNLYAQGLVSDFGAPLGIAATPGVELQLFAPR